MIKIGFLSLTVVGVLSFCCKIGLSAKFPNDLTKCKLGDEKCFISVANELLHSASGHPGLNLIPLDPLHISSISLKQGGNSPVNIDLQFKNVDLIGLKDVSMYKVEGFTKDPVDEYVIRMRGPVISLIGPYSITGKILILPIQGTGNSNMTLYSPDFLIQFKGKTITKSNKVYLQPTNFKFTFNISRLHMNLKNLYNGDKLLGDATNLFMNENWLEIFNEIKESIFQAFGLVAESVFKNVLRKIPYNELFVE